MLCQHCGTDTPHPAIACQSCRTPFPSAYVPNTDSETISYGTGGATGTGTPSGPPKKGTGPLELGAPFGTRYRILRELGAGGMGVVYQAWDAELGVAVALKVVRPEVSNDPEISQEVTRRFKRELLLARQVTHKNVVRIHDLGEIDGIKYITMPYIEGRDLAGVLRERGQLPAPEALRIGKQVAAGLLAAHDAGVVHRDLKPENIMIDSDGQALIMDFGISRSVTTGNATVTAAGAIMGTLEYMAPEQATGVAVDHRADIYAFGLILHDMLAGRRRIGTGSNALSEMMGRMQQQPPALRTLSPEVPEPLERIVTKCLQPKPEQRYETTRALVDELNALDPDGQGARRPISRDYQWKIATATMLVLILIGMGTAVWYVQRNRTPPAPPAPRAPLAVLIADFRNATNESVFQGSLEQALAIALEGAPFISAYSRSDAQRTIARLQPNGVLDEKGARIVAAREGVNVVLAGEIASSGQGYALDIKAIDPRDEKVLFSRKAAAASKADVLQAIGTLASDVRKDLGDTANAADRAADVETFTAGSIEAMQAYVRGKELDRAGKPREGLKALEEAVRLDKNFGMAYAHIGTIYRNMRMDDKAKENYDEAFKHLDRMTEREKYRTYGVYFFGVVRNYKEAIKNYEKLVQLYPSDNTGYANLALAHLYDRNIPQAVAMGRKAVDLYPRNLLQRTNLATYSMYAGDFKTALAEAETVLKENPKYEWANLTRSLSLLASGDEAGARDAYARLAGTGALGASLANMGEADREMYYGRNRQALAILERGIEADEREKDSAGKALKLVAAAEAHLALGNRSAAAAAAERASRLSDHESVLVPAAHVLLETGGAARAREIAGALEQMLPPHIRSYARVIKADIALYEKRLPEAVDELHAAEQLHDSWIVHQMLGQVYQTAGRFLEASREWETCIKRRGEATDVFLADTSSIRYLPPVYYWLARAQEAAGAMDAAAASYGEFLKIRSGTDGSDALAADARKRLTK
jgi:tetratricopeptide (TPR) repeat protein/tRNA A-37 threonylcarbamoyl transferase component Bud32